MRVADRGGDEARCDRGAIVMQDRHEAHRIDAILELWSGEEGIELYSRQVLTAPRVVQPHHRRAEQGRRHHQNCQRIETSHLK